MEIKSLGNNGLVIYLGIGIEKKVHQQVLLLRDALKKNDYIKSLIPAYNSLTLEFDHFSISKEKLMEEIQSIQITNMQGQLVQTISEMNTSTISLNDLETGVYLFRLKTDKGSKVARFQVY